MSKERVCCNCRHNIREKDKKYKVIICRCEVKNIYLSYATVMEGWCKHWAKEKQEVKK